MKKFFVAVLILWIAFLAILIFREQIISLLGGSISKEEVSPREEIVKSPSLPKNPISPATQSNPPVQSMPNGPIPFAPLPPDPKQTSNEIAENMVAEAPVAEKEKSNLSELDEDGSRLENQFGLICTKFEKVPSRFRLVSWEGSKKVQLEDLAKDTGSTKVLPRHWFNLRVPYKELVHPSTKESFFRPTQMSDPNKRLLLQSIEIKNEVLSFSNRSKPVAFLILRDFKIGGPPYQITNEMEAPLTSSYYLQFEQNMGPKKFFHDLTGRRNGHKFGGWGLEYQVTNQNFPQNKVTVLRKDLKTGKMIKKDLFVPTSL